MMGRVGWSRPQHHRNRKVARSPLALFKRPKSETGTAGRDTRAPDHDAVAAGDPIARPTHIRKESGMALKPTIPTPANPPQPMPLSPGATPAAPSGPRPTGRPQADRRALVVGRGIALSGGAISDCERLEVHGTAEVSIRNALELIIADSGVFRGEAEIEDADISGAFDGAITVTGRLVIRASGRVSGTIRCARLMVEEGAQVSGRIEMIPALGAPAASAGSALAQAAQPAAAATGSAMAAAEPALARG